MITSSSGVAVSQHAQNFIALLAFLIIAKMKSGDAFCALDKRAYSSAAARNKRLHHSSSRLYMNRKKKATNTKKKKSRANKAQGFAGALRELQNNSFRYAGSITPGKQTKQKVVVDESISIPDYAIDGMVRHL